MADIYKTIFLTAPWGIALIDSITAQILEANPAYCKIVGRTVEELKTMHWIDFTHLDDVQRGLGNIADMNIGKTARFSAQERYIQSDGTVVHVDTIVVPVKVVSKPCHICMIQDVSVRVIMEEKLAILARETLLINENLQNINKVLEASNIRLKHLYPWAEQVISLCSEGDKLK